MTDCVLSCSVAVRHVLELGERIERGRDPGARGDQRGWMPKATTLRKRCTNSASWARFDKLRRVVPGERDGLKQRVRKQTPADVRLALETAIETVRNERIRKGA